MAGYNHNLVCASALRSAETSRWYVVQTKPKNETRAGVNLRRQGFRLFSPQLRTSVRHARKVETRLTPLFPGYLFLNLSVTVERWRCINSTLGVTRIITQDDRPQPVPQGIVEAMILQCGMNGVIDFTPAFRVGEDVRICDGPFADFIGKLDMLDAQGRVRVLLDLMGRSVAVATRVELLSAVG